MYCQCLLGQLRFGAEKILSMFESVKTVRRDAFVSPCPILETLQISILYCIYIQYVHVIT